MPSVLCVVAATGHTYSHGAVSQCWQNIGWKYASGLSAGPSKYVSIRIQCISRPRATSFLPTVGMLFSAWQAITHALHPTHLLKSTDIPHAFSISGKPGYMVSSGCGTRVKP